MPSAPLHRIGPAAAPTKPNEMDLRAWRSGFAQYPAGASGTKVGGGCQDNGPSGNGCGLCGQTLDQFDDFKTPAGCKPKESFQKTEAFDGFIRWSPEPLTQVRGDCGLFHLAP